MFEKAARVLCGVRSCARAYVDALRACARYECGQATVEAAFALPVMLLLVLLLVQPCIVLYDRMVMQNAAAEGCRLLATTQEGAEASEDYIRRRLSAVPQHDLFHVHNGSCSWNIELSGGEGSAEATVRISTEVKPLPLIGAGASLLRMTNGQGNLVVSVESTQTTQPSWASESPAGLSPAQWIGAWL